MGGEGHQERAEDHVKILTSTVIEIGSLWRILTRGVT